MLSLGLIDLAVCPHTKQGWTILGAWIADGAMIALAWWTTHHNGYH